MSQRDACRKSSGAAISNEGLAIAGAELADAGVVLEVRDGGAEGSVVARTGPIRRLQRGGLCRGFSVGTSSERIMRVTYFRFIEALVPVELAGGKRSMNSGPPSAHPLSYGGDRVRVELGPNPLADQRAELLIDEAEIAVWLGKNSLPQPRPPAELDRVPN